ncbi:TonB-dependent receptor domain-containing protein [Pseudoduganella sp. OTU4001]|uniref:TonB-dependent receptor domain-containing protein n=1 Tax=Pseudoduganella sp. OTU4001 TaxID=3043854 RepID=UPI00313D9622
MEKTQQQSWKRSAIALAAAMLAAPLAVQAQEKLAEDIQSVVVTGSHIRGAARETALPVDVISAEDMRKRGAPTVLDVIKSLPNTGAVLGESNQTNTNLGAQNRSGGGTINLRGIGPQRTLVLLNGKRMQYGQVDTNLLPQAAIGRVEILKDGAAATYGSDAIGGVSNFITRTDLRGFDMSVDHRLVKGSDGDSNASAAYGWGGSSGNVLLSAGYQRRSALSAMERDWAYVPRTENPTSYSTYSNPGTYFPLGGSAVVRDTGCAALGGENGFSGATPVCQFAFAPYLNLIEKEERYQIYGEANADLSDSVRLHTEMLYAANDTPDLRTSPGFPPFNGVGGPFAAFSTPVSNPGAQTALQQAGYTAAQIAAMSRINLTGWRPFAMGGSPLAGGKGGAPTERKYSLFRMAAGLEGDLSPSLHWNVGATYVRDTAFAKTPDILGYRLQQALNGLGGPNCSGTTPGANGCQYFNPFSNAIAGNPALGLSNPGYVSGNANSDALNRWLFDSILQNAVSSYWVGDAAISGQTGWNLAGGSVDFAVGAQYRHLSYAYDPGNANSNYAITPCPVPGQMDCASKTGAFIFQGTSVSARLRETVHAAFGELNLPVSKDLNVQAAVRYEDYGGATGSTTNPKLAAKWQATSGIALRGSVGSTFRGPAPGNLARGGNTVVAFLAPTGGFRAVDNFGNPDVGPEKAKTFNLGVVASSGKLRTIVDYWSYKLDDQIVSVPAATIAGAVAGTGAFVDCSSPLRGLVTFDNNNSCVQGVTRGANMARIQSDTTNGPQVKTSGIDASIDYSMNGVMGGKLALNAAGTYILKYDQGDFVYKGVTVSKAYDARGFLNYERLPGAISRLRGSMSAEYSVGNHNLRATMQHIGGVTDDRGRIAVQTGAGVACTLANAATTAGCALTSAPVDISSFTTLDLSYLLRMPWDTTLTLAAFNVFDKAPPTMRTSLNYDPSIGNPYGRTFKVGLRKQF